MKAKIAHSKSNVPIYQTDTSRQSTSHAEVGLQFKESKTLGKQYSCIQYEFMSKS